MKNLIELYKKRNDLTNKEAERQVKSFFSCIEELLKTKGSISKVGFCSFNVKTRAARTAKVPGTNKTVDVPEKKVVSFKAGKSLLDAINK